MLMHIKVGDVAKLEDLDMPATDGIYMINSFKASPTKALKIEWRNVETDALVEFPLSDFEEHVKYIIPCTPIRFIRIC